MAFDPGPRSRCSVSARLQRTLIGLAGLLPVAAFGAGCGGDGAKETDSTPPEVTLLPANGVYTVATAYSCDAQDDESAVTVLALTMNSAAVPLGGILDVNGLYAMHCSATSRGGSASADASVTINIP